MAILSSVKRFVKKSFYQGTNCFCPICQTSLRQFSPYGTPVRFNAKCPVCGSVERHRMMWLYFCHETDLLLSGHKKMLHIAPESCFTEELKKSPHIDYLSADLNNPAMVKMDVTDIQYPDNSFDVIYCSHVLEHVQNDRKAMKEFARVLSPNGWAILQVPIEADKTFEDPSVTDPKERERLFGQYDHVRLYGIDYKERLEEAGFLVDVIAYLDKFNTEDKYHYGLNIDKDDIYLCQKH
jgi:SAM-dependent methyltransferase